MCRFVDWSCFSSLNKRCILNPSQRVGVCWVGTPGARAVPARSVVLHAWLRCGAAGAGAHCICHSAWPAMLCSGWLRSEWLVRCHPFCGLVRRTSICLCAAKHVPLTSWRTRHRQGGRLVEWWWTAGCGTGMRTRAHHRFAPIACRVQHRATCGVQHRTTCAPATHTSEGRRRCEPKNSARRGRGRSHARACESDRVPPC